MKATLRKLAFAGALLAVTLTTGCASFNVDGDGSSGATTSQGQEDNVALQQMAASDRHGGE
jgi:hypothetical protein